MGPQGGERFMNNELPELFSIILHIYLFVLTDFINLPQQHFFITYKDWGVLLKLNLCV